MNRSDFNKSVAALVGSAFFPETFSGNASETYPFRSLPEAFRALHFDPLQPDSCFFVVIADVHYGTKNSSGMKPAIDEVNRMQHPPAFFCVNGDLAIMASKSFGQIPNAGERAQAIRELQAFKADADLLNPGIPLKITLGNHDTHPGEIDPEIFWEVFPGYPPYQSFDVGGMHVICLNGHSTGYIDRPQTDWLTSDVRAVPEDRGIILLIHQPSMHHTIRERGIPDAIARVFQLHKGPIWLIGGHDHLNSEERFRLRHTILIQHRITCGADNVWGDTERPGYWIYCLQNGRVAGRIFRQQPGGYRLQPPPDLSKAMPLATPIGKRDQTVWRCLVGENDKPYRVVVRAADCLNYWMYVKELIYKVPVRKVKSSKPMRLAIYAAFKSEDLLKRGGQYFLSHDAVTWQECQPYRTTPDSIYMEIGESMRPYGEIYVKFTPAGEAAFAGIALLS